MVKKLKRNGTETVLNLNKNINYAKNIANRINAL